jgi:hypothetical protein
MWEQDRHAETHDPCQLGAGERDDRTGAVRSSKRKHGDAFQPTRQGSTSPARATISSDDGEDETTHLTWINTEIHEESKVL